MADKDTQDALAESKLARELAEANRRLAEQAEELQAQGEELEAQNEELQLYAEELETRVRERTLDLEHATKVAQTERQRLYHVLETLPVYVILLSPDYHVSFENKFFRERFGESRGRRCYEYLFNRTEPCEVCDTYKTLSEGAPQRWEWTGPDGRTYDIYDFPFIDADGQTLIMEMGIDITDRKQAEAELALHRDHLKELVEERTTELEAAYDRERYIAQVLQQAIVPREPTIGEGYEIAAAYIPMFAGEQVGGDFYDVFALSDGRVGILIGDVSGKGVEAASLATSTRSTVRAIAYTSDSPAVALRRANEVLCASAPSASFVTAHLAFLEPPSGRILYASGGHPQQAVLRSDGTVEFTTAGGVPMGVFPDMRYEEGTYLLEPRDEMILYTDGIVEARVGGTFFGNEGIERVARECAGDSPSCVRYSLLDAARAWANGVLKDDTALLVIRRS